jgi:hypothetical protein
VKRTLVIGIPLPDASFDNYSFISAPAISDYSRLVVDIESASLVVEEVVEGSVEHRTFAGQPVANRPTTSRTFALAELLVMRARESRRFFERGGSAVCFAEPDVVIPGVAGAADYHRYGWLPEPEGFPYRRSLLPCFGETRVTADRPHPFGAFIDEFSSRLAYRVCADEETLARAGGRVIGRTAGGEAVAFEVPLLDGSMLFVPPVKNRRDHRQRIAELLLQGFEATAHDSPSGIPDWIRKEVP